ncbi:MAG: discoidin domain-containing protein, partial [Pirellulales bacterium]
MKSILVCGVLFSAFHATMQAGFAAEPTDVARWENLALGKPVTFHPNPNYRHCTDSGDKTQLTDGEYTTGYFWTQKTTVGWNRARPVEITIDLEGDRPIRGLSFNTAAGVAGVGWPISIQVLVSVDGRVYHALGDLVALSMKDALPPDGKYTVHRFQVDDLRCHGRYVKLLIDPGGAFCFVDEIEVFRGEDEWKDRPLPGDAIRYPLEFFRDSWCNSAQKRRIGYDLIESRAAVMRAELSTVQQNRLLAEVADLEQAIAQLPPPDPRTFRALFPMNAVHARVYAIHGAVRAAQGRPPLVAWRANPWDMLAPSELPDGAPAASISLAAMRGETRLAAVNLTNCTAEPLTVHLAFEGLPGGPTPEDVTLLEVAWTDTREGTPVAAALLEVEPRGGRYTLTLPAGLTRQIGVSVTPRVAAAGRYQGQLVVRGAIPTPIRIPISLRVFDLVFPDKPRLHVGGWDYTDSDQMYGVTPANRDRLIRHLRDRFVDTPWATRGVLPYGTFDDQGEMVRKPDTKRFDAWVERWTGAARFAIFCAVHQDMAGTKVGEPSFAKQVAAWIHFWVDHAGSRGIRPEQLFLLLVDEPYRNEQDQLVVAWAAAIKAAEPRVVIWEDPTYRNPAEATEALMKAADVLCPNRPMMLAQGKEFADFYRRQRAAGRRLDFYSCSGPARLLDPYAYYRLQAWTCFDMGAESSFFWAFADTGGGNSWNEYLGKRVSYTPLFLTPDSVTAGKHMEAIRESVEDFEYLAML